MIENIKIKTKIYNLSPLLTIFSIFIFIQMSLEKKFNLRYLVSEYEIYITIKGNGSQQILNNKTIQLYDSISNRKNNYHFDYIPSEILVNGEPLDYIDYYVYNLVEEENNITIKFNVTIENCNVMFYGLPNITQIDFSKFDSSQITSMKAMFYGCESLESLNFSNFDTSNTNDIGEMFRGCSSLKSIDITNFNTTNVKNMENIFYGCKLLESLDLDINNFNTENVLYMNSMFLDCQKLQNIDLRNFITSSVINMEKMFQNCKVITSLNLTNFVTSTVTKMGNMFNGCNALNSLDLSNFITSSVISMNSMFKDCKVLSSLNLNIFDTSNVKDMSNMFNGCNKLTSLDLTTFDTSKVSSMENMFFNCNKLSSLELGNIDTSSVTTMNNMFSGCSSLQNLDLSSFNTSKVKIMSSMFKNCNKLISLNLTSFNTSSATMMDCIFYGCTLLPSIDLSSFNTSSAEQLNSFFYGCKALTSIDVSNFNTSKCINMGHMFFQCISLVSLDLSNFDTYNTLYMDNMFKGCSNLENLNIKNFNTSKTQKLGGIFNGLTSLKSIDLSHFSLESARTTDDIFVNINLNLEICFKEEREEINQILQYLSSANINVTNNCPPDSTDESDSTVHSSTFITDMSSTILTDMSSTIIIDISSTIINDNPSSSEISDSIEQTEKFIEVKENKKCPENTCLSQESNLTQCIIIKPNMKVFNDICFEGVEKILEDIENFTPITSHNGITINGYSAEDNIDQLIKANPDLTFVDLGDCGKELKSVYNLPLDTKLFILAIDSPDFSGNSSINKFDFEIYLNNGTQLKDLSPCYGLQLSVSSNIKDTESVKLNKALEFKNLGYDIYNESSVFYTDICSPASEDGNDITLSDRKRNYLPNISICNEGCQYNYVDYENERFICKCDVDKNNINEKKDENEDEKIEDDQSYLDYFLSLINYKIALCYNLFFQFTSFYYNAGFYISFSNLLICSILTIIFCTKGMKHLRLILYRNIPTQSKLKELLKKENKNKDKDITVIRNMHQKGTINENIIFDLNSRQCLNINRNNNHEKVPRINIKRNKYKGFTLQKMSTKMIEDGNIKKNKIKNKNHTYRIKHRKKTKKNTVLEINTKENYDSKNNNPKIEYLNINETSKKFKSPRIKRKKIIHNQETELDIDFNFEKLIVRRDEDIDYREINNIPFRQALRIDKRTLMEMFISVITNKIGALNLFFYRQSFSHFSLDLSIYLFELLLDLTMNCILYTEDVVSEKYNNEGELSMFTSLSLSLISNIISSIIVFIISKLVNYPEVLDIILKSVKDEKNFYYNIIRFFKYVTLRLTFYFFFELFLSLLMTYYLFIFCSVYHQSQSSVMINYIIGACISLAKSVGISIIITIIRYLSIKNRSMNLFNTSRYLYDRF